MVLYWFHWSIHAGKDLRSFVPVSMCQIRVSKLVGALSPVNHRRLHQGQIRAQSVPAQLTAQSLITPIYRIPGSGCCFTLIARDLPFLMWVRCSNKQSRLPFTVRRFILGDPFSSSKQLVILPRRFLLRTSDSLGTESILPFQAV